MSYYLCIFHLITLSGSGENHGKLWTARSTSVTEEWTWHLPSTTFWVQPLVGPRRLARHSCLTRDSNSRLLIQQSVSLTTSPPVGIVALWQKVDVDPALISWTLQDADIAGASTIFWLYYNNGENSALFLRDFPEASTLVDVGDSVQKH